MDIEDGESGARINFKDCRSLKYSLTEKANLEKLEGWEA